MTKPLDILKPCGTVSSTPNLRAHSLLTARTKWNVENKCWYKGFHNIQKMHAAQQVVDFQTVILCFDELVEVLFFSVLSGNKAPHQGQTPMCLIVSQV